MKSKFSRKTHSWSRLLTQMRIKKLKGTKQFKKEKFRLKNPKKSLKTISDAKYNKKVILWLEILKTWKIRFLRCKLNLRMTKAKHSKNVCQEVVRKSLKFKTWCTNWKARCRELKTCFLTIKKDKTKCLSANLNSEGPVEEN